MSRYRTSRGISRMVTSSLVAFPTHFAAIAMSGTIAIGGSKIAIPIVFVNSGYYFLDAGYWYPAWGYDPVNSYYDYDGPIYTYGNLLPDQVIANVQEALQDARVLLRCRYRVAKRGDASSSCEFPTRLRAADHRCNRPAHHRNAGLVLKRLPPCCLKALGRLGDTAQ